MVKISLKMFVLAMTKFWLEFCQVGLSVLRCKFWYRTKFGFTFCQLASSILRCSFWLPDEIPIHILSAGLINSKMFILPMDKIPICILSTGFINSKMFILATGQNSDLHFINWVYQFKDVHSGYRTKFWLSFFQLALSILRCSFWLPDKIPICI